MIGEYFLAVWELRAVTPPLLLVRDTATSDPDIVQQTIDRHITWLGGYNIQCGVISRAGCMVSTCKDPFLLLAPLVIAFAAPMFAGMDHKARVYENVFEMMPDEENPTPLVRLNRLNPSAEFRLYAKLEWMNPFGSVKDRAAWEMLRDLEVRGEIGGQRGLVEPTSGNTGISLAAMARARGYHLRAVVPNKVPLEKKVLLKIAGAELDVVSDELCPAPGPGDGSINLAKAHAKASSQKYAMPNQYENEKNVQAHFRTTGPEIWRQTRGQITHLFVSLGTCGTVTGAGRFLRSKNAALKVVAVQPTEGHDVPGLRNVAQLSVSKLFDSTLIDEILEVDFRLAYSRALELCQNEGLLAGPSSGLILEGALQVVKRDKKGFGVMIFPDNIFKYTSNMVKHIPGLAEGTTA